MNACHINMHVLSGLWKQNFLDVECLLIEKPMGSLPTMSCGFYLFRSGALILMVLERTDSKT